MCCVRVSLAQHKHGELTGKRVRAEKKKTVKIRTHQNQIFSKKTWTCDKHADLQLCLRGVAVFQSCIQLLTISEPSAQISRAFGCMCGDNFSRAPRSSRFSPELFHHALYRHYRQHSRLKTQETSMRPFVHTTRHLHWTDVGLFTTRHEGAAALQFCATVHSREHHERRAGA